MEDSTDKEMRQKIHAAMETLDMDDLRRSISLQIAADHNVRRKLAMIDSATGLYNCLHCNGEPPKVPASRAFNPHEGPEKTNIYYFFKELCRGMPWEIQRDYLVKPMAITITLFDSLGKMFPCHTVYRGQMLVQNLLNLLTLPFERPEISDEEDKRKREDYFAKIHHLEEKFVELYEELSAYFAELENPNGNSISKAILETHSLVAKIEATTAAMKNLDKVISKLDSLHARTKKLDSKLDLTLYEASGQNPAFKPNGNGSLSPVNRKMVGIAVDEYLKNGDLSVRSICANVMSRFKEVPGAYDDLNTFSRQVTRTIKILRQKPQ